MRKILLSLLLLVANVCFSQVDLNLGLKAYYPFSGNANDVSGNNNNPIFNNATLTADRLANPNSAYHFNGTNNYMRIANSPTLNMGNKLSLSMWVRPTGYYTGQCYNNMMLIKGISDAASTNYSMRFSDVYTGCTAPTTTQERFFDGQSVIAQQPLVQLNQWYHVVVTYDGTTSRLYVNCILQSTASFTGNFTNPHDIDIGHLNSAQFPYWLNGDLDEVRIYDRALNQDEVSTLGGCPLTTSCNNWLSTPTYPSTAGIGNLNVSGNKITVEGSFYCTNYSTPNFGGNLVAKHTNPGNVCYALSPHAAEISTSNNGYVFTTQPCTFQLNKTYHVAMVYDGALLKFYRDGFLMSQIPCSGNIASNNLQVIIGNGPALPIGNQFFGHINEIRIWNVARTQTEIQTYMNSSLPNPTTQTGLLAYYTFNNLQNKQGNVTYNATLNGSATINSAVPNCTFVADSCLVAPGISNIINTYTPVTGFNICDNKLTVEDASTFNIGDTVLLIQMKGAVIDSTNTAAFGTITDYKNSGNYEFNYVKSKTGNIIELKNKVNRQYDIPLGKVQLIRVPYYNDAAVTATLTCLPWDGNKGGVLAVNVQNTLSLNADIDVSGKGFKGGQALTNIPGTGIFNQTDYAYPANLVNGARKGESIAEVSENLIFCRGTLASGGGGGNSSNAGGGGGGNGGAGGRGGNEWGGSPIVLTNGGVGGKSYIYSSSGNKIFMGGAGGAGHGNDASATSGGNGGGIVIINTNTIIPNAKKIIANGLQGPDCLNISTCADGVAGGGAGGTIMINAQTIISNFQIQTDGGKGADNNIPGPNAHGPGGGGGGGTLLVNSAALLGNIAYSSTGGMAGRALNHGNTNWGALNGSAGISAANYTIPNSVVAFQKNIDSVRVKDSLLICNSYDFKGLAYINTNPISIWQWYFGDGGTANTQNTTHTYINGGIYNVKLVVTDINGCKDSITKSINAVVFTADAGADTTICSSIPSTVMLRASAGSTYAWTPAAPLNNPAIRNPTATINNTTRFSVTITNARGCTAMDSVTVTIATAIPNMRYTTVNALTFQSVQLQARNLGGNSYVWLPTVGLDNNRIINPRFSHNQSQEYKINITSSTGCNVVDTLLVIVKGTKGIYVPKAFSPNADGTNDKLYPILVGIKQLNYFRVFNRWGNLVFETNSGNPAAGWNGKINGNEQPPETYTWTAEGIDIDGIVIKKSGNTFLIR